MATLAILDADDPNSIAVRRRLNDLTAYVGNGGVGLIEVPVTADATGGLTFTVPFACKIIEALAYCTASNASGTLKLRRATTDISAAITCAVVNTTARSATIVLAEKNLDPTVTYNVIANGAADRGVLQLYVARV